MEIKVVIIGAGPAGIISAGILDKLGHKVLVVEKQQFPRFVIGESLLPRCMDHIEEAGFMEAVQKAGFQQKFGAVFYRGENTCDFDFSDQYTKGWKWTWQVPRADFDKTLADAAEARGIEIRYQTSVDDVKIFDDHVETTISSENGSEVIHSEYIIDGSGYGRVLPNLFDLHKTSTFPPRQAVFAHIDDRERQNTLQTPESNRISVEALSDDIWVWNIPFSNGNTSVGIVGEPGFFESIEGATETDKFWNLLEKAPRLAKRHKDKKTIFEARTISGYSVGVKQLYGKRYVLTGNSTEFLDPIFSSGVTFAMESAALAAKLIDKEINGEIVDWEKNYTKYILSGVDTFRSFIVGWYNGNLQNIFFNEMRNPDFKKQITSVLAGYVWDKTNPFVKKHKTILATLNEILVQGLV